MSYDRRHCHIKLSDIIKQMIRNIDLDASEAEIVSVNFNSRQHLPRKDEATSEYQQPLRATLQIRSEKPLPASHPELSSGAYKKSLIKLMVRVQFERFGFKQLDLETIIDQHIQQIRNLESVQGRNLSDLATELFLDVFSTLIGERNLLLRLAGARGGLMIEEQRQQELGRPPVANQLVEGPEVGGAIRDGPMILCNICYTMSTRYCSEDCAHAFCLECMRGYLRENLRENNYFIKCAEYECKALISIPTIKALLNPHEFKRFSYFRDKNQKQLNPQNKFCSKPDCGELLHPADDDKLACPKCKEQYCQICLQKYHGQQKCDSVLKNALERTYETLQIKKCPGCKSPIEKSDGCNHMTCKKCRFEFCWLCEKKYTKHHYRYYNCFGCPGMQFENQSEAFYQRFKQIGLYLLLPFFLSLLLLCYIAMVPIFIMASWVSKPCVWLSQQKDYCEMQVASKICCGNDCCLRQILVWVLLQPRALLYAVFISPLRLTVLMCGQMCEVFE